MLYADKVALANRARLRMLEIREKELDLYVRNSRSISTACAMLAGSGYTALVYTKMGYYQNAGFYTEHAYPVVLSVLISLTLLALFILTLTTMLGPGLALRGPDGSVHVAIEAMMLEYRTACFYFGLAVVAFHLMVITYAWGGFPMIASKVALTVIEIATLVLIIVQARHVVRRFYSDILNSGAFYPHETRGTQMR
mmetsp:Transcript_1016/g.2888  ORF Transcript_1016/g.2888 Transcript_1016/m.2888 type:complete len:196 (+) Transcript_1016:91-678(+)